MSGPSLRNQFAVDIFIREMKRQWIRQNPSADPMDCPVQIIEEYPPMQRVALIKAIEVAHQAFTGLDDAYKVWLENKISQGSDKPK